MVILEYVTAFGRLSFVACASAAPAETWKQRAASRMDEQLDFGDFLFVRHLAAAPSTPMIAFRVEIEKKGKPKQPKGKTKQPN